MYQSINQSINQSPTFKGKIVSKLINKLRGHNKPNQVIEALNGIDYAAKTSDLAQVQEMMVRESIAGNSDFVKGAKEYLSNNIAAYTYGQKPKTLGEGLRRVVNAVSEGAGKAKPAKLEEQYIGWRKYDNGVTVGQYGDSGFFANAGKQKGHLSHIFSLMKRQIRNNGTIARIRIDKNGQEVVTDMFAQPWKAVQRFMKKDGTSKKLCDKKIIDLPNGNRKYFEFVSKYLYNGV